MVASIAASVFFPTPSSSSRSSLKNSKTINEGSESLNVLGIAAKPASSSKAMQVKAEAQTVPKINGSKVYLKSETLKLEEDAPSTVPRTFYNQLPDWSMLLAAITTIFLAAEKQWTLLDWKPRRPDMLADAFGLGKFVQDGLAFRQNFSIRSYEIGADRTASIETLMNHLQETALNHVRVAGLMDDGFGATPEMSKRNLIWVVAKMHVLVEKYPSWGDVVQVDTWVSPSGKNGMRRDWHVIDCQTRETIVKATSVWVLMNKTTRKLSKMPDEVRAEIGPYFLERAAVLDEDSRKLPKLDHDTAHYVRKNLTPRWGDLDVNQHVNNVKYIGWILESAPTSILESHELAGMTLEYRRECGKDNVLQSLTSVSTECSDVSPPDAGMECVHLLQLESGNEIIRGRTRWRPKRL
ncbi:palmitoyl-acyl carrier protein thioesterase, chloroplastic-like [Phalaenopsis equestris]|uniref:palmitoyl-acyl carrier protein thioesterase, chloroplastic-like n=1 Tax=Phalaenopsis equestris TaxID=78828 RepID=UPI0009E64404|nr:palmitoyl-acyl carrier protein thioesterase, chloroplastic-like [Phalaenopsis equestris]XP_020585323.1 palmitoyl-acyl carrier protein thioesterase, chloroplastic-like [Phalaenopsis equestris]XP_020585324.1 palmitoyl-acyl carrier protein thioesterase, chloroplastic-like [Phalaenopsis equestris]